MLGALNRLRVATSAGERECVCVCARESEREKEKGMIHWEKG